MCDYKKIATVVLLIILSTVPEAIGQVSDATSKEKLQLIVIPSQVALNVNEKIQFRVEIKNDGDTDMSEVKVKWRVLGDIGLISATGLFIASDKPGRGIISVSTEINRESLVGHAVVKIAEGNLLPERAKRITVLVRPNETLLSPGSSQKFSAEPSGKTQWRVIPPKLGSITSNGLFIAGRTPGKAIIIANVQTADGIGTGRANIIVGTGKMSPSDVNLKVHINPKSTRVERGRSVAFEAKVTGLIENYPLEWEVYPNKMGYIEGAGYKVLFVAGTEVKGRALVTVKVRTETDIDMDYATVDVDGLDDYASVKLKVTVSPESMSLKVGESMFFAADISGSKTSQVSWSVAPTKIGTISENGLFTATAPGWGLVICKVDSEGVTGVGQAHVFVGTGDAIPLQITILPEFAEAYIGGEPVKFTAQVKDKQNKTVANVPIQWKVIPDDRGSIDQAGTFRPAGKTGQAIITAKVEGLDGVSMAQARITIIDRSSLEESSDKIKVSIAGQGSLKVGTTYRYQANVIDSKGKRMESNAVEFEWRVVPSNLGITTANGSNVTFVPSVPGRGVIIVDVKSPEGVGTGRISITIEK